MPQHAETILLSNYTLIKLIRTGISPISAMIGTSAYYGQLIGNPILGSINSLLFGKKLGLDIWNLNQRPSSKTKFINSSKKILLGLGTIGLANYTKFLNTVITPIESTTTINPITSTISPITTTSTTSTTVNPFPDTNLIIGSPTVDYSKISQKYMSAILNFNSVVFSSLIQMPYDSVQWLPFALSDIPLIGKLLNVLSLGIPIGFIINQNNQQYKKMLYFNGFMSAFFTNNLENIIGNGGLIPLNAFAIGKLLGANVSTTAMTMKLTDRISVYPWDPKTGHKLKTKEQISTVDLSQKKNNKVYILAEDTEFLDIASPLTNLDTEMQWNPTSNGVSDGSNYAYIIDTIVTQSLHQGEERHTFYSDNPFTYQGDYNELSIAQFRYKNKGALTSNAFNWTTLYKLNHDEYKETEETTFSYPANILPPSPQNIAKQIVIIPSNPTIKMDLPLESVFTINGSKLDYTPYNWNNYVFPKIKPLQIDLDIKSKLDPTLLINTFNDLKRYYKSIELYISWEYETYDWIKGTDPNNIILDINQTFSNKTQTITKSFDLKDLNYYNDNKELIKKDDNKIIDKIHDFLYTGLATVGVKVNNTNNLYNLLDSNIKVKRDQYHDWQGWVEALEIPQDNSSMYLGFKNIDNNLKFKIELFPIYLQGNGQGYFGGIGKVSKEKIIATQSITLTISKIILNSR
ncbi:hypothetical protein [Spiroplasma endosymbiont of Nebria brevicollis]|uniref:hypothetical protein n=1 Tax=Spiroplasma endosymbiont of Nebria brevicollis TaxID=3066284 RepID=UPI00313B9398